MATRQVRLRVGTWFGEREIELAFPTHWEVVECRMGGHDRPALTEAEMRAAVQNPIGSPPLRELAQGKKEVVILFDDMPKPTPTSRIVPFVLEELHAGGIRDEQIRFLCAPGTHRQLMYGEFVAKLGEDIVQNYPVYNHNCHENTVFVGTTSHATPVYVNREFAYCDLRLGIGSIIPHPSAGFGAGGKMILPGVVSHSTNLIEHPELVAERILRFAGCVGRDNVIAGTDCGLGGRVHPQLAWAKLQSLAQGAELATKQLWR